MPQVAPSLPIAGTPRSTRSETPPRKGLPLLTGFLVLVCARPGRCGRRRRLLSAGIKPRIVALLFGTESGALKASAQLMEQLANP